MKLTRRMLQASVLLAAYVATVLTLLFPVYMVVVIVVVLVAIAVKKRPRSSGAHGTARWAEISDLERAGLLDEGHGLPVGTVAGKVGKIDGVRALFSRRSDARAVQKCLLSFKRKQPRRQVNLNTVIHTCAFAPTGVGKGVSLILTFLMRLCESACVYDPKGEAARLTAAHLRRRGFRVILLDPHHVVTDTPDRLNPLFMIDKDSPLVIDHCRAAAEEMVVRTGHEQESYWNDSAEAEIAALMTLTCLYGEGPTRNLQAVRSILADADKRQAAIRAMTSDTAALSGLLARMGHTMAALKDKELASVTSNGHRHTRWLDTPAAAEATRDSTFDPRDLTRTPMVVFIILPPDQMKAMSGLLRLWVGTLLRACVAGGLQETNKVHFVLDEAGSLGPMSVLEQAVNVYRGYGVRLQFYYQSVGQLKKCWPDGQDQTLLTNCSTVWFGINDFDSADALSKRLGDETIGVLSTGTNAGTSSQEGKDGGRTHSRSTGESTNWSQIARRLLKPEEVIGLDPRIAITCTPGVPPIVTWLHRFYEPEFSARRGIGPVRAFIDAACLLLTTGLLAALATAMLVDKLK